MNIILFDDERRSHLLPLTYTRPVADLRLGILTLREKWLQLGADQASFLAVEPLREKFPTHFEHDNTYVAGSLHADEALFEAIRALRPNQSLVKNNQLLAIRDTSGGQILPTPGRDNLEFHGEIVQVRHTWDLFSLNAKALAWDFERLTRGRKSARPDDTNTVLGEQFFMEESAQVSCSIINAAQGPVYLGHHSEIWEGSAIRGPFALLDHASVKMGAKIYGATTVGPHSRVGGEISNVLIQGYSNKGHDGFLGNSVLGEWCNLGADTNNSNLKNNYAPVKLYNYSSRSMEATGLQFCGLIMGDHSKCGINTMFNTGTVVGVSANIFGEGFPPNFIPSFTWGGKNGLTEYQFDKAAETAERMMARRNVHFNETERRLLQQIFNETATERN